MQQNIVPVPTSKLSFQVQFFVETYFRVFKSFAKIAKIRFSRKFLVILYYIEEHICRIEKLRRHHYGTDKDVIYVHGISLRAQYDTMRTAPGIASSWAPIPYITSLSEPQWCLLRDRAISSLRKSPSLPLVLARRCIYFGWRHPRKLSRYHFLPSRGLSQS